MKKSEIYKIAQMAVLEVGGMSINRQQQLEVLKELMEKEELALFREQQEERGTINDTI